MKNYGVFLVLFFIAFFSSRTFSQNYFVLPDSAKYVVVYLETGDSVRYQFETESEKDELNENIKNKMVDSIKYIFPNSVYVLPIIDEMPEFPGGEIGLKKYIAEKLKYQGSTARVYIRFIVNTEGKPVDIKVVQSSGNRKLDMEALRVIESLPKFKPAVHNGIKVNIEYTIPIDFGKL